MITHLLDTNIVIYTLKNKPRQVRTAFEKHYGKIAISTITIMELVYGAERSVDPQKNLAQIEGLVARLETLDYDDQAAYHTGQIRADLANKGTPIGPYDQMLAGQARSNGLVIVTNNEKEFKRVEGLRVENWV